MSLQLRSVSRTVIYLQVQYTAAVKVMAVVIVRPAHPAMSRPERTKIVVRKTEVAPKASNRTSKYRLSILMLSVRIHCRTRKDRHSPKGVPELGRKIDLVCDTIEKAALCRKRAYGHDTL